MGVKALRKVQMGLESTAGAAVAADEIWRGRGTLEDTRELVFPDENVGYLSGVVRSYTPKLGGQIDLDEVEATFEQLPYLLTCGISKDEDGAADGEGSGKVYSFAAAASSEAAISTMTVEGGDDAGAEEMEYCYAEKIKISGKAGEAVMMSATLKGRQVAPTTFTADLTLDAVEEILCSKGKLYIDLASGTIGTTLKSNTFREFELEIDSGWIAKHTAEGQTYFSFIEQVGPKISLKIVFEHDATAIAQKVYWRAETPLQVRLIFTGSALGTAGTYTYKTLIVDLAGLWEKFDKIGDADGNDIISGTFRAAYDSTAALFAEFVVVNEVATL